MPTYLYECPKCGRFEKFQKISAEPLKECPECGNEVKRIIGAPGIIFKGSGFYATDSREDNKAGGADKKEAASTKEEKAS